MSHRLPPWPRFSTVALPGSGLPEPLTTRFPELTVPGYGGICCPTPERGLLLVAAPDGTELIQFGNYHGDPICLDPTTGRVVDMVQTRGQIVRGPLLVNSSLALFLKTTKTATELFPYHADDPDADFQAAADELRAKLEPIDSQAWAQDGLWDTFYWDITIGDYSPSEFEPATDPGNGRTT